MTMEEGAEGKAFNFDYKNLRLNVPFRMQISGASGSGKSSTIFNFVKFREEMFQERFNRCVEPTTSPVLT